ncbi:transmembrane anchor protein [Amphritea balenae]|uniref:Transmembrane anchor protein n=1 Tax=Amphritea balenae TaxID=452629 RepID=A0A3P1SP22_9GAMM|nr:transmembrane anchor protein [Amphritea balenae]RRC98908.1 transmembrane anchor protein [Amphritea balenae]GGK62814.1 hypothetical protein GCM10007941_11140 [Amphritea balenae]
MYNANISDTQQLPTSGQLIRSTLIALVMAIVLLITVVMPAEYAIDPTGIGRMLGLTQMGEIKEQLAEEAEKDAMALAAAPDAKVEPAAQIEAPVVAETIAKPVTQEKKKGLTHEISFRLMPGQPAEIKLEMIKGAKVNYSWSANGGKVNYDTHGDPFNAPKGFYHGYGKGRFQPEDNGVLVAAFDGVHGWFWRNRTDKEITITLKTEGDYQFLERVL